MVYLFILANSDSIEANDQDTTKDEGTNDSHIQIWYIYIYQIIICSILWPTIITYLTLKNKKNQSLIF